jgi:hypothetical protein
MKPGFYEMSAQAYHQQAGIDVPALTYSCAKRLLQQSPWHAWHKHPKLGNKQCESTDAMAYGTACHAVILGMAEQCLEILPFDDFRTKAAKDARDTAANAGKCPILQCKMTPINQLAEAFARQVRASDAADFYAAGHQSELAAIFETDGVVCQSLFDRVNVGMREIWDIKTTQDASDEACRRTIVNMGYDIQEPFYRRAMASVLGVSPTEIKFTFLFVETSAPYAVNIVRLDPDWQMAGDIDVNRAVKTWGDCLLANEWPGYAESPYRQEVKTLSAPAYRMNRAYEAIAEGAAF